MLLGLYEQTCKGRKQNLPIVQRSPSHPLAHSQVKKSTSSWQVAPFSHGSDLHSSTSGQDENDYVMTVLNH